jgi:S-adenosylmethionine decarboxylase
MALFFEGPEKKVELVVTDAQTPLRSLGDDVWSRVVGEANAQILSKRSTDVFDAYLLSESSLFVYDEHITLITCGQTTLVDAVFATLDVVPPEHVAFLALERKNEHFPHEQPSTFHDDARRLSEVFPGRALRFGDEHSHCIHVFHTTHPFTPDPLDTTLEILMHGIEGDSFVGGAAHLDKARATGIGAVLSGFQVDDHAFEPAGYSLNALKDDLYYTFHVTPEEVGSYVSFETNFDFRADPASLVQRVVSIFQPHSFDVFAFSPDPGALALEVPGYRLNRHVYEDVNGYGVTFLHLQQPPEGITRPTVLPLG